MNYRIATIADLDKLTRLRMAMRRELDADFQEEFLLPLTRDFFQRNISNGSHVVFVCEDEGRLIADAGLTLFEMMPTTSFPNGKVARLMNMYVVPEYRRKGIAKRLLEILAAYAREIDCARIMLNPSAAGKQLYLSFGFQTMDDEYAYRLK